MLAATLDKFIEYHEQCSDFCKFIEKFLRMLITIFVSSKLLQKPQKTHFVLSELSKVAQPWH